MQQAKKDYRTHLTEEDFDIVQKGQESIIRLKAEDIVQKLNTAVAHLEGTSFILEGDGEHIIIIIEHPDRPPHPWKNNLVQVDARNGEMGYAFRPGFVNYGMLSMDVVSALNVTGTGEDREYLPISQFLKRVETVVEAQLPLLPPEVVGALVTAGALDARPKSQKKLEFTP